MCTLLPLRVWYQDGIRVVPCEAKRLYKPENVNDIAGPLESFNVIVMPKYPSHVPIKFSINPELVFNYLVGLVEAINKLNSMKYVHCDIKPANIFINDKDDDWLLGDFGSCSHVEGKIHSCSSQYYKELIPAFTT